MSIEQERLLFPIVSLEKEIIMNRRSMIKHAALGGSAVLLTTGNAPAQRRNARPNVVIVKATKQAWKYRMVRANQEAMDQAGREMWEAVCVLYDDVLLFKQPA